MPMKRISVLILLISAWVCAQGQGSVLSSGEWWRIVVSESGMHRITTAEVPELSGVAVESIGLYGGNGEMLSMYNSQTSTADLQPVAIDVVDHNSNGRFDAGDEILFYGEGTDVWRYDDGDQRWELRRHAYATANSYYLTTTAPDGARIATSRIPTADTTVNRHTAVAMVNNDLVNIYESGQLWMGEKFTTTTTTRSFSIPLPATADRTKLRYAMAHVSGATSVFRLTGSGFDQSHYMPSHTSYQTYMDEITSPLSAFNFQLAFSSSSNTAEGYFDYMELNGRVPLSFGGGQLSVRSDPMPGHTVHYAMSGSNGTRVWDVTHNGEEIELSVQDGGWSANAEEAHCYAVFDGSSYLTPAVERIANQNLHGAAATDYVVVTHPAYLQQAQRLAALHEIMDGLSTLVVTDQMVYNEFSSGKADPMAIRSLLRWLKSQHPEQAPRYLLLFGKATYDNRDLLGNGLTTVVTYETSHSFDDGSSSYCSDDIIGYLDDNEFGSATQSLDVSIGRLPAKSEAEAELMVTKIERYMMRSDLDNENIRGDWRNYIALLADDADPSHPGDSVFAHSSEVTARRIIQEYPTFNIDRLYADAYHQQSGAIGSFYPELNNALKQRMDYGCLLINYIGHGSSTYIGTERFVEFTDINNYSNHDRLPVMVTSTCSYGHFDRPTELCGSEALMLAPAAAIAVIAAARPISHIERFNTNAVLYCLDPANGIGDALRKAKNSTAVSPCIGLVGDPALKLSQPMHNVVVTAINDQPVQEGCDDTATVLSRVTIEGEIRDVNGNMIDDFDGRIYPIVFDREVQTHTLANDNPGTEVTFRQQKNVLYKGNEPVSGGRFAYSFTVPRDVAYQYAYGKLSHYAKGNGEDAAGSYSRLLFGGLNEEVVISESRPEIHLYIGDSNFRDGGITDANPTMFATLSDETGINAVGSGLGHDITAILDGNANNLMVLNDFYEPDIDDSRRGILRYALSNLEPGRHTLVLKAWNIFNYSNADTVSFIVCNGEEPELTALIGYPNPASDNITFHIETDSPATVSSAELQIFSSQGRLIKTFVPPTNTGSYVVGPVRWDTGSTPPGIYLARMVVSYSTGEVRQSSVKCIVK